MTKPKPFKPMLFVNKIAEVKNGKLVIDDKEVPKNNYYTSRKVDGIRILIIPHVGFRTRSMKEVNNKNIEDKLMPLYNWCCENNIMLDGEMYQEGMDFQEITSIFMTKGREKPVPKEYKFYCFDALKTTSTSSNGEQVFIEAEFNAPFKERFPLIPSGFFDIMNIVQQTLISPEEYNKLSILFDEALSDGYEGLILKGENGHYKRGRTTEKDGLGYKFKDFITDDMEIFDVVQATVVDPLAEKTINETGHSVTSKKKDDRILVEKASAFWVSFQGNKFKVSIAESDEEKKKIWEQRDKYIGEFVEVKYTLVGSKDGVPRHPTTLRMRWKEHDE